MTDLQSGTNVMNQTPSEEMADAICDLLNERGSHLTTSDEQAITKLLNDWQFDNMVYQVLGVSNPQP